MPFPTVEHCLVCEDLRQERARKTTVLGFYGIAPNVEILVQDFGKPVDRLGFLLLCGRGEGRFRVSVRLLDQEGRAVAHPPKEGVEISLVDPKRRNGFGFGFIPVKFAGPGKHTFLLEVDGQTHYETTFGVEEGKPEDFV